MLVSPDMASLFYQTISTWLHENQYSSPIHETVHFLWRRKTDLFVLGAYVQFQQPTSTHRKRCVAKTHKKSRPFSMKQDLLALQHVYGAHKGAQCGNGCRPTALKSYVTNNDLIF